MAPSPPQPDPRASMPNGDHDGPTPGTPSRAPHHSAHAHRSSGHSLSPKSPSTSMTPQSAASPDERSAQHDSKHRTHMSLTESTLDPRHFTPSLHASLVSEILALRRELESKSLSLDGLESTLAATRAENDALQEAVSRNVRESRNVKKQLQSIEDSTLSAIQGLVKERDDAVDAKTDLRRRVEDLQRRNKGLEEQTKSMNNQHALDKQAWDTSRFNLERRALVAETRLEGVLAEVAAASQPGEHVDNDNGSQPQAQALPTDRPVSPTQSPDAPTIGTPQSAKAHRRQRSSVGTFGTHHRKDSIVGRSLAEEIDFDNEEQSEDDEDAERRSLASPKSVASTKSVSSPKSASSPRSVTASKHVSELSAVFEPTSSGKIPGAAAPLIPVPGQPDVAQDETIDPPVTGTRGASDTSLHAAKPSVTLQPSPVLTLAVGTQTEWPEAPQEPQHASPPPPTRAPPPVPDEIPFISIHPPDHMSESAAGRQKLPPHTKSLGCQTDFAEPPAVTTHTASTQTDPIAQDLQPPKRQSQLLPSAISDSMPSLILGSGSSVQDRSMNDTPNSSVDNGKPQADGEASAAVGDEQGEESAWARLKKAFRNSQQMLDMSQLPPELANLGQEDEDEEESYLSQPIRSSFRSLRDGRPAVEIPTPVPEDVSVHTRSRSRTPEGLDKQSMDDFRRTRSLRRRRDSGKSSISKSPSNASSSTSLRRRSSGRPPIPPRGSSHPRSNNKYRSGVHDLPAGFHAERMRSSRRPRPLAPTRLDDLPTRDLAPASVKSSEAHSPVTPYYAASPLDSTFSRPSRQSTRPYLKIYDMTNPTGNASVNTESSYSVVDAITATMIGEWMWKFVRKRKTFGVGESLQESSVSETRHRRWVWLSPYDRTIMWSNKQPTSNAALMGKPGRKLEIQSVLDIKDESVVVKDNGEGSSFGRSILVLTPERALKFTACNRQRHYLWLTALSFLSQENANAIADLQADSLAGPYPSPADPLSPPPAGPVASSRGAFSSVRSSIGRAKSNISSGNGTPTVQSFDPRIFEFNHRHEESLETVDAAISPSVPRIPKHSFPKHNRKRSATIPSRGRAAYSGVPSPAFGTSLAVADTVLHGGGLKASSANSSESYGAAFDRFADETNEPAFHDATRQMSDASAEFGGNSHFFDAGGLVRMHAFVSPGMVVTSSPTTKKPWDVSSAIPSESHSGPHRGRGSDASSAFSGPPPIRQIRRRSPPPPVPVIEKTAMFRSRLRRDA